ncbi:Serine protease 42 [Entomophthora muscae]|uniref:Serine protease 42 n=1 Tax=Entomophthora muscae TaxID=34485 RepID=A0ACC2TWE5_9FUNG|nr:Serine protease 42 [Entomophthora muscae]
MKFTWLVLALQVAGKGGDFEDEAYTNKYLATIFIFKKVRAAGVFYTDDIVLTAASTSQLHIKYYRVVKHPHETINFESVKACSNSSVVRIVIHPDYVMDKVPRNNIALMKVNISSTRTTGLFLDHNHLASTSDLPTRLLGWAWQSSINGDALFDFQLPTLDVTTCRRSHYFDIHTPSEFCAGFYSKNYESMYLLPGSPLLMHTKHHSILVGILSWTESYGVADFYQPPVFTAINHFHSWALRLLAMKSLKGYSDAIQLTYDPHLELN